MGQPKSSGDAGEGGDDGAARSPRGLGQGELQGVRSPLKMERLLSTGQAQDYGANRRRQQASRGGQQGIGLIRSVKGRHQGGVGAPLGLRYQDVAGTGKKLGFADQVSRKARDRLLSPKGRKNCPSVGHYHPQFGQVATRPVSHGWTKRERAMHLQATSTGLLVPAPFQEDTLTVPKAFCDQLQKIRAEKMIGQRNNFFKTNDQKHDPNINSGSMMQNDEGQNEAQPRQPGAAPGNEEQKHSGKGGGHGGRRQGGAANVGAGNQRDTDQKSSKVRRKRGPDPELLDQEVAASDSDHRSYKIGRFCNTMKVFKQFCSIRDSMSRGRQHMGKYQHWSAQDAGTMAESAGGESWDYSGKGQLRGIPFKKQSRRKDISEGEYSANEERFCSTLASALNPNTKALQAGKYARRDAKPTSQTAQKLLSPAPMMTVCDNFTAPITGDGYDHCDNYDLITRNASGPATTPGFEAPKAWTSTKAKRQLGKFRLTREQLGRVDFDDLSQTIRSATPRKGKARRRQMNKEDNDLFMQLVVLPHMRRQSPSARIRQEDKLGQMQQW